MKAAMKTENAKVTSIAPQFLVEELMKSVAYYRENLGFDLDYIYEDFYASVSRDGFSIHLKGAKKIASDRANRKENEHLDAYIGVQGIAALYHELVARGALITKPLGERPWNCADFYVEDIDGYILGFSEIHA